MKDPESTFASVYKYKCTHTHTHMRVCAYTYIHACIHTYIHTNTFTIHNAEQLHGTRIMTARRHPCHLCTHSTQPLNKRGTYVRTQLNSSTSWSCYKTRRMESTLNYLLSSSKSLAVKAPGAVPAQSGMRSRTSWTTKRLTVYCSRQSMSVRT